MDVFSTVVVALSMSADAFAVAVAKGAGLRHPKPIEALRTGAVFGAVEAATPVIGWAVGALASRFVASVDHWIAFVILSALGIKMFVDSLSEEKKKKEKPSRHKWRTLVLAAIGSSIDAMGVGVTLAFIDANIWITAAAIGTATFVMASTGMMIGHIIGQRGGKYAEMLGGIMLVGIGTAILVEHVGLV